MAQYQAPKPKYPVSQWITSIAARVFFPPVLLWDLAKLGVNKLAGQKISKMVLPAQDDSFDRIDNASDYDDGTVTCDKHSVTTHDGATLDTFEVTNSDESEPSKQKYIINLVGNGMSYTQIIDEMIDDAKALDANVVGFDFRGVGASTNQPRSKDDLVTDGIAQVQRLLDQGVSPQNITLKGHSLGAGIASLVGAHFHDLGKPINVFNSRSFSSITNFVVGQVRLKRDQEGNALNGHDETKSGAVIGWLMKPFVKLGLALSKWEINAADAFKRIPKENREYIVVRANKNDRNAGRTDDIVIPHYASMHTALKSERRAEKAKVQKRINKDNDVERESLLKDKKKIGACRKMKTDHSWANGHNVGWTELKNRYGQTAQTFFRAFVDSRNSNVSQERTTETPVI